MADLLHKAGCIASVRKLMEVRNMKPVYKRRINRKVYLEAEQ